MPRNDRTEPDFMPDDARPKPDREFSVNPREEVRKSVKHIVVGAVLLNMAGPVAGDLWAWLKALFAALW